MEELEANGQKLTGKGWLLAWLVLFNFIFDDSYFNWKCSNTFFTFGGRMSLEKNQLSMFAIYFHPSFNRIRDIGSKFALSKHDLHFRPKSRIELNWKISSTNTANSCVVRNYFRMRLWKKTLQITFKSNSYWWPLASTIWVQLTLSSLWPLL